jgi:hypothetical protein
MSSAPTAAEIARDATWLAQALDPAAGVVRLIAMDRGSYRAASFLDDRMLQTPVDAQIVPWPAVEEAMVPDLREDARWIFHIGHVGSTLISRLVGEMIGVLAVREPRLLRDLAMSPDEVRARYLAPVAKLMSRTFATDEIACVKATSFVSEIAPDLVPPAGRALFLFASPRNYVASILAGENSLQELHVLAPSRAQRMAGRVRSFAPARHDADLAAAAWACEMTALEAAADALSNRHIHWADFDGMLDDMTAAMEETAAALTLPASRAQLEAILEGPLMGKYSKALEYDYSPALRRDLIADADRRHRREIEDALAMLGQAGEQSLLLARALERSGKI